MRTRERDHACQMQPQSLCQWSIQQSYSNVLIKYDQCPEQITMSLHLYTSKLIPQDINAHFERVAVDLVLNYHNAIKNLAIYL